MRIIGIEHKCMIAGAWVDGPIADCPNKCHHNIPAAKGALNEIAIADIANGLHSWSTAEQRKRALCVFEALQKQYPLLIAYAFMGESNTAPEVPAPPVTGPASYDGAVMDIPWIIRSLEQLAQPLNDNETGIHRHRALCDFVVNLKIKFGKGENGKA